MDEIHDFHDFGGKLTQASVFPQIVDYVRWRRAVALAEIEERPLPVPPDWAPISINLDLTTACNFRCDHCIDWDILNTGVKHKEDELRDSLRQMAGRGMKSVILIGGGEPTVYPRFVEIVRFLKQELRQQVAVVTNGSRGDRLLEAAEYLEQRDWVRLSLDSGTDETFQRMHKPTRPIMLDEICEWIPKIKQKNPAFQVGFSFIVTWKGAQRDDASVVENIDELVLAAERARRYRFDYISIKPFLIRAEENGSEVMDPSQAQEELQRVTAKIRSAVTEAKKLQTESFKVVESTNLRLLADQSWRQYTRQPRHCHMQFFRQVLTPHGVFNCPAYRSVPKAQITQANGYKDATTCEDTRRKTGEMIQRFDASHECREVTCLYNTANWWLEEMINGPDKLSTASPAKDRADYFL